MTYRFVYWLLLSLATAHTLWRGGAPERWGIAILVAGSAITPLVLAPMTGRYQTLEWSALAVDLATYVALLVLAVVAARFWPLWVSAMQGVGTATHLLGLFHEGRLNLTYAILVQLWTYPMIALIVIGSERHRRRLDRIGSDPSWKSSFVL